MSTTVILYPTTDGIAMIRPVDPTIPILEIARGTTPAGAPFIFIDENELPDFEYFDAWTADFSNPDGYGIGLEAWAAERQFTPPPVTPTAEVLAVAAENEQKTKEINDALAAALLAQNERDAEFAAAQKAVDAAQAEATALAQSMPAPPAPDSISEPNTDNLG